MNKIHAGFALLAVVLGLALAACGGGSSSSSGREGGGKSASSRSYGNEQPATASEGEPAGSGAAAAVSVGEASGVGQVLVNSAGLTLYYFEKDQKGSGKSQCEGACAEGWPPLTSSGEVEAMAGVKASLLGTIERSDGTTQVTYSGWPLYTFVGDTKPGEDNGTDSKAFGASWYPLHPNGEKAGH